MPTIYDNKEKRLIKGLNDTLELSHRADFCVGYFNLRGWKQVAEQIESLEGETIVEGEDDVYRICRLLVGMQKMPAELLRDNFSNDKDDMIDQAEAVKQKKCVCVPNLASNSKLESNLPRLLDNIPAKAYDYAVNGKSAIEGIVERYQVKIDRIISDSADTSASCFAKNRKIFVK